MSADEIDLGPANEPLRPLEEIFEPDPRHGNISLERWYEYVSGVTLGPAVPAKVKQMLENAKMAAVYTYFAYRAHQGFQMLAFSALEKALWLKYELEKDAMDEHKRPRSLHEIMELALAEKWITNKGYRSSHGLAYHRAQMKLFEKEIKAGLVSSEPRPMPEPTEEQVLAELDEMDVARTRLHAGRHVRNFLMHGDGGLGPGALATLEHVAEEINQLFP